MATFSNAFQIVLKNEGGYVNDPNDPGGETYKGIARNINSKWDGWVAVDLQKKQPNFPGNLDSNVDLQEKVQDFYQANYWDRIKGDNITNDEVATSIFDFAVNAGVATSASLAQMVVGVDADGVIGDETVAKINEFNPDHFSAAFAIAKIARYINIVKKRPSSQKYFYGWVRRTLGDISN
jgi:lysozyme family protein